MLEAVAELARRNLVIFADEIYDKLVLDDDAQISLASVAPDVPIVTFGGLEKLPGAGVAHRLGTKRHAVAEAVRIGARYACVCARTIEQWRHKAARKGCRITCKKVNQAPLASRSHDWWVQFDQASVAFAQGRLLRLPASRHSRGRRCVVMSCSSRSTCWSCTARASGRRQAPSTSASCSCPTSRPDHSLCRHRRLHEGAVQIVSSLNLLLTDFAKRRQPPFLQIGHVHVFCLSASPGPLLGFPAASLSSRPPHNSRSNSL